MLSKPRSLSPLIVALFLLVVAMPGAAAELAEQVDPVEVSPTQFKIDFENDHVRIVSYHLQPGERDNWHTHPAKVSVITGGGLLRITTKTGGVDYGCWIKGARIAAGSRQAGAS